MLSEKLVLLNAIVRRNRANAVLARLLHAGFFHPFDVTSISGISEYIDLWKQDSEPTRWKEIEKRIRFIEKENGFSFSNESEPVSYAEAETTLSMIEETLKPLFEERHRLHKEISHLEIILEKKPVYLPVPAGSYTFIHSEIGEIKADSLSILENMLENIPHIIVPADVKNDFLIVGVIILKKDFQSFERIKKEIGWQRLSSDIIISDITEEQYREKIEKQKLELNRINEEIQKIIRKNQNLLEKISTSVDIYKKISIARSHAGVTDTTMIISGWIPQDRIKTASDIILKVDGSSYCEYIPAEKTGVPMEQIPVKFKHNRLLKPFELIVKTYGIPRYNTLDPTVFVAISFLLMFGAMFGDVGHGAVFIIFGLLMLWRAKGSFKQAGYLVTFTGIASTIFGFLYGSVFGIEFHPVWLSPMENISLMFRKCIIFGVIILTAGIVLNMINHAINRDKTGFFFDKAGLFSGLIFWAGAGIAVSYFSGVFIPVKILSIIFAVGILTIFFRSVFETIRHKEGLIVGIIEGVLHVFEIMMGYLANTISFIRISAFTLNHFGFFMTIFAISGMLKNAWAGWLSWVAIIFGNIFVIVLEGLVVLIQSLRLNYYEFFSRFFIAGETVYQPLTLKVFNEKIEKYIT